MGPASPFMRLLGALMMLLMLPSALSETILRLDQREWTLNNENGSLALTTSLPAYPVEVLRANGVIGDPLYRYGEQEARWVALESWTFTTSFSGEEAAALAQQEQVLLHLGGLDTFADVSLNGKPLLVANNFHRFWNVAVKDLLDTSGDNKLVITLKSAYEESIELQENHPYYLPTLYNTGSIGAYNFARKPAFDFGWDWGPAFAAAGIHGTVKLIAFSQPTLAGAYVAQLPTETGFTLKITSQLYVPPSGGKGKLRVTLPELKRKKVQSVSFNTDKAAPPTNVTIAAVVTTLQFDRDEVTLWWPAGANYGPHKLYDVEISFSPDGNDECTAAKAEPKPAPKRAAKPVSKPVGFAVPKPAAPMPTFRVPEDQPAKRQLLGKLEDADGQAAPAADAKPAVTTGFTVPAEAVKQDIAEISKDVDVLESASTAGTDDTDAAIVAGHSRSSSSCAADLSSLRKRVGFRTIELVRDPLPKAVKDLFGNNTGFEYKQQKQYVDSILSKNGAGQWAMNEAGKWTHFPGNDTDVEGAVAESFYLRINGLPIFMKGANVIPMTVLPSNTTTAIINMTLQAAVNANQNMLRVWGGGLYHPEAFYEFCDEHGLLVWQDAMFGGSPYPRNPEFLANVAAEITQQAQRLSWHPSLALWCGNNELELSYEWPNNTLVRSNRNMFAEDYMVNINLVRKLVKKVNPNTIFVSSSPSKGPIVDTPEEYVLRWGFIGDPRYGTVHHYDYGSDCEDFRSYPAPKFISEFGWQSYPMLETYAAAMNPETDWGVGNPMNEFRNRRTDVTPQFLSQFARHFKLPEEWNPDDVAERMKRFKSYLWIGHMQHARCYETAFNLWRRLRSHAKSLTMGVMYWQLNDIWAGASWSSVDISGRWKPVHYSVKRAFAPLSVQAILDVETVDIFVVSDLVNATKAAVTLQLVSLDDTAATCDKVDQAIMRMELDIPGAFATRVLSEKLSDLLKRRPGCTPSTCFLVATATAAGMPASESQLWFVPFKEIALPDPSVRISQLEQTSDTTFDITLQSDAPAALVLVSELQPLRGYFSDNVFATNPCEKKVVTFVSIDGPIAAGAATSDSFRVESLFDHSSWAPADPAVENSTATVTAPQELPSPAPVVPAVPAAGNAAPADATTPATPAADDEAVVGTEPPTKDAPEQPRPAATPNPAPAKSTKPAAKAKKHSKPKEEEVIEIPTRTRVRSRASRQQ